MLAPLVFLLIAVPILELYVIIQVGGAIGALPTIALLVADSALGSLLIRSQGRAAWRRLQRALAAGRPPAREAADGALVLLGGALLLSPGFVTDAAGLLCLLPPTRVAIRRALVRRLAGGALGGPIAYGARRARRAARPRDYDVDGTATDLDAPRLP